MRRPAVGRAACRLPLRATPRAAATARPAAAGPPPPDLDRMRADLADAVSSQDFAQAAELRDQIREIEAGNPLVAAERALAAAVAAEDYAAAAAARDAIAALQPPPYQPPPTTSKATTQGVTVSVKSFFIAAQSSPESRLYTFAYRITIKNESDTKTVRLLARRWEIKDGDGGVDRVAGPGVVGETPTLTPGGVHSYSSFAQLRTPGGAMEGAYVFVEVSADGTAGPEFEVEIARFGLDVDDDVPPAGT